MKKPTGTPAKRIHMIDVVRELGRTQAAQTLGSDTCWLITTVAEIMDSLKPVGGDVRPVAIYAEQLMNRCNWGQWKQLKRCRDKAIASGWLEYEGTDKGSRAAGTYFVRIPPLDTSLPYENTVVGTVVGTVIHTLTGTLEDNIRTNTDNRSKLCGSGSENESSQTSQPDSKPASTENAPGSPRNASNAKSDKSIASNDSAPHKRKGTTTANTKPELSADVRAIMESIKAEHLKDPEALDRLHTSLVEAGWLSLDDRHRMFARAIHAAKSAGLKKPVAAFVAALQDRHKTIEADPANSRRKVNRWSIGNEEADDDARNAIMAADRKNAGQPLECVAQLVNSGFAIVTYPKGTFEKPPTWMAHNHD